MTSDEYGHATIRNIYFDTPDYRIIRRSLERPVYKEKLRLRAYRQVVPQGRVFAELKKKYDHVVYKRCLILSAGKILMEVKCAGGIPLWMTRVLTKEGIFRTSFSKYGTAYQKLIFKGGNIHA